MFFIIVLVNYSPSRNWRNSTMAATNAMDCSRHNDYMLGINQQSIGIFLAERRGSLRHCGHWRVRRIWSFNMNYRKSPPHRYWSNALGSNMSGGYELVIIDHWSFGSRLVQGLVVGGGGSGWYLNSVGDCWGVSVACWWKILIVDFWKILFLEDASVRTIRKSWG